MNDTHLLWIFFAVLIAIFMFGIGFGVRKHILGILIDSRGMMSLSQLQVVAWSIFIISAFFSCAIEFHTMNIIIPPEVWGLMGISIGSTAGAVLIKGNQKSKTPDLSKLPKITNLPDISMGVLRKLDITNKEKPRLAQLFLGEEIVDDNYVDIGKVQMFFFTLAVLLGYAWALSDYFDVLSVKTVAEHAKSVAVEFPPLSGQLLTLLGISHAGYLTIKAAPKTPTT